MEALVEELHQKLRLPFAHEALVNEHAGELIADRPVQQEGQGGGIHAPGEGQQHPLLAHLGPHIGDRLVDEGGSGPIGDAIADVISEIADQGHAAAGVHHLRMELHAIQTSAEVGHRRLGGVVGVGQAHEALRQALHRIAVAHPHRGTVVHVGEQVGGVIHMQRRLAVFGPAGGHHRPAQLLHHQLHAVADPQHRDAQVPQGRVAAGCAFFVDRAGAAAEDDPLRGQSPQLLGGDGVRQHEGEHLRFAHPAGDQLGILGTKIKDHQPGGPG